MVQGRDHFGKELYFNYLVHRTRKLFEDHFYEIFLRRNDDGEVFSSKMSRLFLKLRAKHIS